MTLKSHLDQAEQAYSRSHALWKSVNGVICHVLRSAIKNHKSKASVCRRLRRIAGPQQKGEPVSLGSFRAAARSIEAGESLAYL